MDSQKRIFEYLYNSVKLQSNLLDTVPVKSFDFSSLNIYIPHHLSDCVTYPNICGDTPLDHNNRNKIMQTSVLNYMQNGRVEFIKFVYESNNKCTIAHMSEIFDSDGNPKCLLNPKITCKIINDGGGGGSKPSVTIYIYIYNLYKH